jgi:hypothetical protein
VNREGQLRIFRDFAALLDRRYSQAIHSICSERGAKRRRVSATRAGVVELADAPDSKSGGLNGPCGFKSLLRHHLTCIISPTSSHLISPLDFLGFNLISRSRLLRLLRRSLFRGGPRCVWVGRTELRFCSLFVANQVFRFDVETLADCFEFQALLAPELPVAA